MTGAPILAILGALGGLVAFIAGCVALLRGIFRQVGATDANTRATQELTSKLDRMARTVDSHAERISRLEGRDNSSGRVRGPRGGDHL